MKDNIAHILALNLEAIEQGEITLGEALARNPEHREELVELLPLAIAIWDLPIITPRPGFRYTARSRILREISARQQPARYGRLKRVIQFSFPQFLLRPAVSLAIVIVLLVGTLSAGTVFAAGGALPGDRLYPVKTAVEDARLTLSGEESDAPLYLQFAEERLEEINALAAQGRYDEIPIAAERLETLIQSSSQTINEESLEESEKLQTEVAHLNQGMVFTNSVLTSLLNNGELPGNSEKGIKRALMASNNAQTRLQKIFSPGFPPGPPLDLPVGPPVGTGPSDQKPEGPQGVGPEKAPGPPDDKGQDKDKDNDKDKDKDNKPESPPGQSKESLQGPPPDVTQGPPDDKDNPSNDKPDNPNKP